MPLPFPLPSPLPGDLAYDPPMAGETLSPIASICAEAQALIISEYKDAPLVAGWLCSYLDRLQALDTATAVLYQYALDLERAEGVHLDLLGRIVREARDGRADSVYRRSIRVRVLVNRSQGRIEDLIAIASLFEDDAAILVREYQPARVTVSVLAPAVNSTAALRARLRRAKAAGVALATITNPAAPSVGRMFRLGHGAASTDPTNTLEGLSWTGDTRGGYLSHVVS